MIETIDISDECYIEVFHHHHVYTYTIAMELDFDFLICTIGRLPKMFHRRDYTYQRESCFRCKRNFETPCKTAMIIQRIAACAKLSQTLL